MKALILAAGTGSRLGALTTATPKPLLPIGGEPLIVHTLRLLARHGFDRVAVNLHHRGESIRAHLGDGAAFGVAITYSPEERLLGTAGAVKRLQAFWHDVDDFLVIYGDLLIDQDLGALVRVHRSGGAAATLLLHQRASSNSLVRLDERGRITGFVERPTDEERRAFPYPWVNSGVQVLSPRLLERIPPGVPADLPRDVYVPAVQAGEVLLGVPLSGYRCAIDSPARYAQAQADFAAGRVRADAPTPGA